MGDRTCEFSRLAEADLEEIALFIGADNPKRALSFISEIRSLCNSLTENPRVIDFATNMVLACASRSTGNI